MLRHYFSMLLKKILQNRLYTVINVSGLALGLACTIILSLFVLSEVGYDDYHENKQSIYRLTLGVEQLNDGSNFDSALTSFLWAPALSSDYPEIDEYLRIFQVFENRRFLFGETAFQDERFVYADGNLFSFFSWRLLQGDPATALNRPYSVVISESMAKRHFGEVSPLGKTLNTYEPAMESPDNPDGLLQLTVTGIMADIPYQSHLKPSMVASFSTLNDFYNTDVTIGSAPTPDFWRIRNVHTYLQLNPQATAGILEAKFPDFINRYVGDSITDRGLAFHPYLQRVDTIHLNGPVVDIFDEGGNSGQIAMFALVGAAILIIACINFMNLTTAQSITRACEIGVRKVSGAHRRDLISQFLGESVCLTLLALVLAVALAELLNPVFYAYIGREFYLPLAHWPFLVIGSGVLAVLVGIVSGVYPAFVMANVNAVDSLQMRFAVTGKGRYFSKALVALQFSITIFFLCATLVVYQQRHFMVTHDLGVKSDRIVIFPLFEADALGQIESIRTSLLSFPGIQGVTVSNGIPGAGRSGDSWALPGSSDQAVIPMEQVALDYDYVSLYGLELLAGRDFDKARSTDAAPLGDRGRGYEMSAIVNEATVKSLGIDSPEAALGKRLVRDPVDNDFTVSIIGVIRDFHQVGLQNEIRPTVFYIDHRQDPTFRIVSVQLAQENNPESIKYIGKIVTPYLGERPFEYYFLDQYFQNRWYQNEQRLLEIFGYITGLMIFIACMGLLGLATFSTEQRTKEIGIRKVMGSSVWSIVLLLTNDFSRLVLFANVIAWPVAWYAMNHWLANFAYRIDLTPLIFIGSGLIALCIAWVTVGGTAAKAANQRPVLALRYE